MPVPFSSLKLPVENLTRFYRWYKKHYGNAEVDLWVKLQMENAMNPTVTPTHVCPAIKTVSITEEISVVHILTKSFTP